MTNLVCESKNFVIKSFAGPKMVERPDGPATVLAIGTANPPNVFYQHEYPNFYFNVTNSNHMTDLKRKFQRICGKSGIEKRHMVLSEESLKANPSICAYMERSLDVRQEIAVMEVPKLGKEAAEKALKEWGQPKSKITHLVFCSASGVGMPGADWELIKLLGLRPSVKRHMMYNLGCYAGGTALRVAKDVAENNKGARILVVCSETLQAMDFRGPSEAHVANLVGQALFGDGAAALIVGSDPIPTVELPLYEIRWVGSRILPDSDKAVDGHLGEVGGVFNPSRDLPRIVSSNVGELLRDAFEGFFYPNYVVDDAAGADGDNTAASVAIPVAPLQSHLAGGDDTVAPTVAIPSSCNDMFWVVHPGGRAILDAVEERLQLKGEKLAASRLVLSEYGNMSSASVLFIMDEMRKRSVQHRRRTTGEGCDWGVLLSFGPGITCETVILKAFQLTD